MLALLVLRWRSLEALPCPDAAAGHLLMRELRLRWERAGERGRGGNRAGDEVPWAERQVPSTKGRVAEC